jgi:NADPH-dependent curcumin reductase CurA
MEYLDVENRYTSARKDLAQWLAEGKIKRKETIVHGGLAKAEEALMDLYKGMNTGIPTRRASHNDRES